jgi:integrase
VPASRPAQARRANGDARPYYDAAKGRWKVAVELGPSGNGRRRRRIVSAASAAEARALARRTREQLAAGIEPAPQAHTVASFLRWWESTVLPGTVSEGSEETYRRLLRLYVVPCLGAIRLAKLTPGHVTEMMRAMEDRGLSPSTRNAAKKVLGRALRRAVQEELVHRNVAMVVEGAHLARRERRSLTAAQARALLQALQGERLGAAYHLALALGLRRGEVLGLTWEDLDLDARPPLVAVRRQLQRREGRGLVLTELKTAHSRRTLALPPQAADALRRHRAAQAAERLAAGPDWASTKLVFTTPLGTPVDPNNFRRHLERVSCRSGLGPWTTHELRHSAGSLLFAMGVPMKVISETLGHSSERVTSEVYVHLQAEHRQAAADAMARALWG